MSEGKVKKVLSGCLDNLPTLNSRLVRIFISSTFTDTREERNILLEDVYPRLKTYCKEKHGMDFQLVDMRWGVPVEASNDHAATQLCLQEIDNCQKLSTGPNFVTFLNQKHGYRPLQVTIPEEEFVHLTAALLEYGRDSELIMKWYLKDENQVPAVYVLQPITSLLPGYSDKENKADRLEWDQVFMTIREDFKFAAKLCLEKGQLNEDEKHKYFMSVTEDEIYNGILKLPENAADHCLCFVRIIEDISKHLDHDKAWRFIDVQSQDSKMVDEEAQTILSRLRDEKLIRKLQEYNVKRNLVNWSEKDGINREDHAKYLESFKETFYNSTVALVDKAVHRENLLSQDDLYIEVLQHASMAMERCALFHGREDILAQVTQYLQRTGGRPLVLIGQSGSGKTSIMARVAKLAYNLTSTTPFVVLRFMGTSPESSNLWRLLRSLCEQIVVCYSQDKSKIPEEFTDLKEYFLKLLSLATKDKPLIILLDSLDQLSREHSSYKLNWLPRKLPNHVSFIVSTYTEALDLVATLRLKLLESKFISVPVFTPDLSEEIIKSLLKREHRTLTKDQFRLVSNVFEKCSLPLFVKLVYDQALQWKSYTPLPDCQLSPTVQQIIDMLFSQLEKKHGAVFVRRALAYVSASQTGISETELEDLLSLDDIVLTSVYEIHVPPLRRIPPLLWVRVRHDISQYLVDKEVDEVRCFFWYHRQFFEVANKRYLSDKGFEQEIHSLLADYYNGKWHGVKKPFCYTPHQMKRVGASSPDGEEDRRVSAQQLVFSDDGDGKVKYNLRKLSQLPMHLFNANRQAELRSLCLFNYTWIQTKLKAMSIQDFLLDYTLFGEKESVLHKAFKASQSTLKKFPSALSLEISGRLLALMQTKVEKHEMALLQDSLKASRQKCCLVPYQPCYVIPNESLMYVVEHANLPSGSKMIAVSSDSNHLALLSMNNEVLTVDLITGEIENIVQLQTKNEEPMNVMVRSQGNDFLIIGTSYQKKSNPVFVVDMTTGAIEHQLQLEKQYAAIGFKEDLMLEMTQKLLIAGVVRQAVDVFDLETGKLLHEFPRNPDQMKLTADKTMIVLHPKQTKVYEIFELKTFQLVKTVQLTIVPDTLTIMEQKAAVTSKDSSTVQIVSMETGSGLGSLLQQLDTDKVTMAKIQQAEIFGNLCLVTTVEEFILYNLTSNKKTVFPIPREVKPDQYRVLDFVGFLTPDLSMLVAGYDRFYLLWEVKTGKLLRFMEATRGRFTKVILSQSGEYLVDTCLRNNSVQTWNVDLLKNRTRDYEPLSCKNSAKYFAIDYEGNTAVVRSSTATEFVVIDINQGIIHCHISEEYEAMRPDITSDGKFVVLREYNGDHCLKIWDTSAGNLVTALPLSSMVLKGVVLGTRPENMAVLTEREQTGQNVLSLSEVPSGKTRQEVTLEKNNMMNIFFANDDKYCIVGIEQQLNPGVRIYSMSIRVSDGSIVKEYDRFHPQKIQALDPLSDMFAGQRIHTDKNGKESWEFVIVKIETGHPVITIKDVPSSVLNLGQLGRYGIDNTRYVFDLQKGVRTFQFDPDGDYSEATGSSRDVRPKMTANEQYCIWLQLSHNLLKVGEISSQSLVSVCPIHSIPESIQLTMKDIILIGCEDGRIMMLQLVAGDSSGDSSGEGKVDNILKKVLNRSMKKSLKVRESVMKTLHFNQQDKSKTARPKNTNGSEASHSGTNTSSTCSLC